MGAEFYLILDTVDVVLPGFEEDLDMEDVEEGNYASIDRIESHESYWHMEDFTAGLPEGEARSRLEQALIRSKPFRHFKDALEVFPPRAQGLVRVQGRSWSSSG